MIMSRCYTLKYTDFEKWNCWNRMLKYLCKILFCELRQAQNWSAHFRHLLLCSRTLCCYLTYWDNMTIYWLPVDYLLTICWLPVDYLLTICWLSVATCWLPVDYLLTTCWLSVDYLLTICCYLLTTCYSSFQLPTCVVCHQQTRGELF